MKPACLISNRILLRVYKESAARLEHALNNLEVTQENYLLKLLRNNSGCLYGKINDFLSIRSVSEFQKKLPVTSYEDYLPFIERIRAGEKQVLTKQTIKRLSLTSGTSSGHKLIPSTNKLTQEFHSALGPWIYYNYKTYKGLSSGTSFWVITPAGDLPEIKSMVPVEFDEDSNYFGKLAGMVLHPLMAMPNAVSNISDMENYYYVAAYFLLSSPELSLISVWNPSLLGIFCDKIRNFSERLLHDVREGSINPPTELTDAELKQLKQFLRVQPKLATRLSKAFEEHPSDDQRLWVAIWPRLSLISCWTDGWAGDFLPRIRQLFPGIPVQGKGLMATEAIVSIPFTTGDSVLAATSHFYEFIDQVTGDVLPAQHLKKDTYYEVVVTTGGGLYRYRLNDIIRVTGFYNDLPRFRFIGKKDLVSDICGEKLHEYHVSDALRNVFLRFNIPGEAHFLIPEVHEGTGRYLLYIHENNYAASSVDSELLAEELDRELRSNFHYDYCRRLSQLQLPEVVLMNDQVLKEYMLIKSKRWKPGTVKFPKLEKPESLGKALGYTKAL